MRHNNILEYWRNNTTRVTFDVNEMKDDQRKIFTFICIHNYHTTMKDHRLYEKCHRKERK